MLDPASLQSTGSGIHISSVSISHTSPFFSSSNVPHPWFAILAFPIHLCQIVPIVQGREILSKQSGDDRILRIRSRSFAVAINDSHAEPARAYRVDLSWNQLFASREYHISLEASVCAVHRSSFECRGQAFLAMSDDAGPGTSDRVMRVHGPMHGAAAA